MGIVSCVVAVAACTQPAVNNEPDNKEVKEHRDQWRPREAQSDFLDIGKQAGIEWLSFVPQDQLDYPEYFEGLDRDQKNRLRLAPKGSDKQVLIQFNLPEGSKLWPVDWYGTELMAIERPEEREGTPLRNVSLAIAEDQPNTLEEIARSLAEKRADQIERETELNTIVASLNTWRDGTNQGEKPFADKVGLYSRVLAGTGEGGEIVQRSRLGYSYCVRRLETRTLTLLVVLEYESIATNDYPATFPYYVGAEILRDLSVKREIALEGSPKHKCTSTLEEQLAGTLRFPDGTLNLPVSEDMLVRKIGGDSTIQIDGHGAEPWILIRRLDSNPAEGDIRATLRKDTTFNRRLKVTSGRWSAGYVPEGAKLPIVCFDYDDTAAENNLLGILKTGNELLTFEVVTRGVRDGEKRRAAKQAAIKLLTSATADPATKAPELKPLVGWNMGTMGQDD